MYSAEARGLSVYRSAMTIVIEEGLSCLPTVGVAWLGVIVCDRIPRPHDACMLRNWPGRLGVAVGELKSGPGPSNFHSWGGDI